MSEALTRVISKVARLGGAILCETNGEYYLVGELKEPCDFEAYGFEKPPESDPNDRVKFQKLKTIREISIENDYLEMETQGGALAELLFKRFAILRNYSISDRLWRMATVQKNGKGVTDARWLEQIPDEVWEMVRDSVLKCL